MPKQKTHRASAFQTYRFWWT